MAKEHRQHHAKCVTCDNRPSRKLPPPSSFSLHSDPSVTSPRPHTSPTTVQAVGFPWYREDEFLQLRAMFADGEKLHRTYAEWRRAAETGETEMRAKGARVVRAEIRPDAFAAWCAARGLALDAKARMEFANEAAYRAVMADRDGTRSTP